MKLAAWLWVRLFEAIDCVAATEAFTVRLKVFEAVWLLVSVTVTVNVVVERVPEGVPVIAPVDVLKLRPAGRVGEMLYASVPVPFAPVTGVKLVTA